MINASSKGFNSDRIGELGEIEFKRFCSLASVLCSKVQPDKTGKDYIVEFHNDKYNELISYDKRAAPVQIVVQVKTVGESVNKVPISISVAERLAKDFRPAILCIFKIDKSDNFVGMYFIEIIDKNLAKILERLRKEFKAKNERLNKSEITFPISKNQLVDMNASAFYAKLRTISALNMDEYAANKSHQLLNLGYDENRFSLNIIFDDEDENSISDGLLGLKPLKVLEHREYETRFNISLPHNGLFSQISGAKVNIEIEPLETVKIIAQVNEFTKIISAEWRTIPSALGLNKRIALASWNNGSAKFNLDESSLDIKINFKPNLYLNAEVWLDELNFSQFVLNENCNLSISGSKGVLGIGKIVWPEPAEKLILAGIIEKFEVVNWLFSECQMRNCKIDMKSVLEYEGVINLIDNLRKKNARIVAKIDKNGIYNLSKVDGMFISAIQIGQYWFGISFKMIVEFTEEESEYTCTGNKVGQLHFILLSGEVFESFEAYRLMLMRISQVNCAFVQRPGDFLAEDRTLIEYPSSA